MFVHTVTCYSVSHGISYKLRRLRDGEVKYPRSQMVSADSELDYSASDSMNTYSVVCQVPCQAVCFGLLIPRPMLFRKKKS